MGVHLNNELSGSSKVTINGSHMKKSLSLFISFKELNMYVHTYCVICTASQYIFEAATYTCTCIYKW